MPRITPLASLLAAAFTALAAPLVQASEVLVSGPEDAIDFASTGVNWSTPLVKAWSQGSFQLSVIPERSAAILDGLGLCSFGLRRSRRA